MSAPGGDVLVTSRLVENVSMVLRHVIVWHNTIFGRRVIIAPRMTGVAVGATGTHCVLFGHNNCMTQSPIG